MDDGARRPSAIGGAKRLTITIGKEAAANFKAWFELNFVNPRAGRIGGNSYSRAGELDDRRGDWTWYPSAYGRAFWDHVEPLKPDEEDYIRSHPLVAFQLALGVTDLRGLRCLRRGLTLRANALQRKSYRSRYYASENAQRRQLAAERRKIHRRTTTNPCPTPDGFREAFARAKESAEAKIFFGGMVHDLACYVDSCLRYDESGNITGRNGGIKEWLAENVPELYPRYKTIMRHKALAMRTRQLAGLEDPQPTSVLLDHQADGTATNPEKREVGPDAGIENYSALDSHNMRGLDLLERKSIGLGYRRGRLKQKRERLEQKRERLRRVLAECRNTFKDVFDRIDSELGADIGSGLDAYAQPKYGCQEPG